MSNAAPEHQVLRAPPGERRAAPRYACGCEVPLYPLLGRLGQPHWAIAKNASQAGVGLLLNCPFPDSPLLIMEVPGRKGQATHHAVVRVVRERCGPDGNTYLAGVFEPPLSERVLEDLLAGGMRGDSDEEA